MIFTQTEFLGGGGPNKSMTHSILDLEPWIPSPSNDLPYRLSSVGKTSATGNLWIFKEKNVGPGITYISRW